MRRTVATALAACLPLAGGVGSAAGGAEPFRIQVRDASGKLLPCRIHLTDAPGKPVPAPDLPFFRDHFSCRGAVELRLEPGAYSYEIERGPEHERKAGSFRVEEGKSAGSLEVALARLDDLSREGWWSGDLHVHRPLADIEILMAAEDLHVAPVITWWNARNQWAGKSIPEERTVRFDGDRFYEVLAGEDEREGGALLFFHLPEPLPITGAGREHPSPSAFLAGAKKLPGAWADIEKPFWWDTPVWLASGLVDSIGIANNHMCRAQMYEDEAWGRPRDAARLPPPRGNGFWTQEIYYHALEAGLRLPPSAGSASGVLPNPVGYNRVYVHVGGELGHDKWWEGLRAGRSFVTNGPLLRVRANGELPGHVFRAGEGEKLEITLEARLSGRDVVPAIEIVRDGAVERSVPAAEGAVAESPGKPVKLGTLIFGASGWFLVRAIADNPKTFRFASTAPFYVEVGANPRRISRRSVRFFLEWVRERMARVRVEDAAKKEEVLRYHRAAEEFWSGRLEAANAE